MKESQPAYYAVIPADVRYCKELSASAKLLYGEITALCSKKGFCWASNKYFADLYNVSPRSITRWITELAEARFVGVDENVQGGRRILLGGVDENVYTPLIHTSNTNTNTSDLEKSVSGIPEEIQTIWNKATNAKEVGASGKNTTIYRKLLPECRKISEETRKVLSKMDREEARLAIRNYLADICGRNPETDFALHRFSFHEFFTQKNGFKKFLNK